MKKIFLVIVISYFKLPILFLELKKRVLQAFLKLILCWVVKYARCSKRHTKSLISNINLESNSVFENDKPENYSDC